MIGVTERGQVLYGRNPDSDTVSTLPAPSGDVATFPPYNASRCSDTVRSRHSNSARSFSCALYCGTSIPLDLSPSPLLGEGWGEGNVSPFLKGAGGI